MSDPAEALAAILATLSKTAQKAGRDPKSITLVAVSKTHESGRILPVLQAGHRVFGENRVQEAQAKWPALRERFPDISLHLIGPLQTNKVREAVAFFDVIETVDREKLARKLSEEMGRQGRRLPVCLQVNTGEEPQKAGVKPGELDDFVHLCRDELKLDVRGLMAIPPVDDEPSFHFALLRKFAEKHGLPWLSMGMSADWEIAVAMGATHIRLGTAIFGTRAKPLA